MSILSRPAGSGQRAFAFTFAPVPTAALEDGRLEAIDVRALGLILGYARGSGVAWPANSTLAARLGVSLATVKRSLARLAAAGWVARERVQPRPGNMTGRILRMAWAVLSGQAEAPAEVARECPAVQGGARPTPAPRPPAEAPGSPVSHEGDSGGDNETDRLSTPEILGRLPGRPDLAGPAAARLATDLSDWKSVGFFRKVARIVATGAAPAARILEAYRAGRAAGAAKPGALFSTAWRDWIARPETPAARDSATVVAAYVASKAAERAAREAEEARAAAELAEFRATVAADPTSPLARFFRPRPGRSRPS